MDINALYTSVNKRYKMILNLLPKEEIKSPSQYLQDIFETETLPTINEVFPNIVEEVLIKKIHMNRILDKDNKYVKYRLSDKLSHGSQIIDVIDLVPISYGYNYGPNKSFDPTLLGNNVNKYGRLSSESMYGLSSSLQLLYADAQLLSTMVSSLTWYFIQPNILKYNKQYDSVESFNISLQINHDKSLLTVPDNNYGAVKKLFTLDVQSTIYDQFKYYEVDTLYGQLDYKLSDWSSSGAEREEYYEKLKSTSHFRKTKIRVG